MNTTICAGNSININSQTGGSTYNLEVIQPLQQKYYSFLQPLPKYLCDSKSNAILVQQLDSVTVNCSTKSFREH